MSIPCLLVQSAGVSLLRAGEGIGETCGFSQINVLVETVLAHSAATSIDLVSADGGAARRVARHLASWLPPFKRTEAAKEFGAGVARLEERPKVRERASKQPV